MKSILFLTVFAMFLIPVSVSASEIYLTPEKNIFNPNDWIKIVVNIDGYTGEDVLWSATKPDGTIDNGKLNNIKASKTIHTITRNAFDHQFGTWTIEYVHNDAATSIDIIVEKLTASLYTNQEKYFPGDHTTVQFSTNYYEPSAAYAGTALLSIVNQNNQKINQFKDITFKVYQPQMTQTISISDITKYNPFGTYKFVVKYFGIETTHPFEIIDPNSSSRIFLGSDKSLYQQGDSIEINIGLNKLPSDSGILSIISPSGKEIKSKVIEISNSLTRIKITDDILTEIGTYTYKFEYGGTIAQNHFDVLIESLDKPKNTDLNLTLLIDKQLYLPGERMLITVTTNNLIENNIIYWFENPNGKQTDKYSFAHPTGDLFRLSHILPLDAISGPWNLFVKYGQAVESHVFFVDKITPSPIFIPDWIKGNAKLWNEGKISDSEFAQGIEFMIKEKIIPIPDLKSDSSDVQKIPEWIKNNAGWWADEIISDQEFADGIEFLVKGGIIRI